MRDVLKGGGVVDRHFAPQRPLVASLIFLCTCAQAVRRSAVAPAPADEIAVQRWVLARRPNGGFVPSRHAKLETETLVLSAVTEGANVTEPAPVAAAQPGDVIVKVDVVAIDAFLRTMLDDGAFHTTVPLGATLPAIGYGTVVWAGSGAKFKVGDRVSGMLGAGTYVRVASAGLMKKASLPGQNDTLGLGLLGVPGMTAYIGINEVAKPPKKGECAVVSAAAGSTGSIAAQLAKINGARVVGIAGGPAKKKYLLEELGLDGAVDYKDSTRTIEDQLKEQCPDGIDFFYDNVGGKTLDAVLNQINMYARVVICGAISQYNTGGLYTGGVHGPANYLKLAEKSATMQGFAMFNHGLGMVKAGIMMNYYYYRGKLQFKEEISSGIASFPEALASMFSGAYIGRKLVDISGEVTVSAS